MHPRNKSAQLCSDLTETTNAKITIFFVVSELPELKIVFLQKKEGKKERRKERQANFVDQYLFFYLSPPLPQISWATL